MTTVTVDEARENLPELLRRVAAGEEVVITDGGKWVAALGTPPNPGTYRPPVSEGERIARLREFFRMVVEGHEQTGNPFPADHPVRTFAEGGPLT